ncbi:MAG: hypothetical protein V3W18_05340 [candidate division Zixibacteria bacterium]
MGKRQPDADDKFRYLGFDINPGKIGEFWQSDDERKKYLKHIQAADSQLSVLDRESSLVNVNLMSSADRIVSFIGNIILILAFFLPAYSITLQGKILSGSAISYFLNLPFIGAYAAWGGAGMILTVIVYSLILIACPAAGVLNIIGLINKNKGDDYLETVKKYSRFTFVPILLYIALLVILLFGGPQPFGSLGAEAIGKSLNLMAIFTIAGFGFWVNIAGLSIAFAQSRGL